MKYNRWTEQRIRRLAELYEVYKFDTRKWVKIGAEMDMSPETVRAMIKRMKNDLPSVHVEESPYPRYDSPLVLEGDAVVFPDMEMPFHHADFVNNVLELARAWDIRQCIMAGDMLHFDSLSGWEPNWQKPNGHGGLDEKQERAFMDFAMSLGSRQQARAMELLEQIGPRAEDGDPNVSEELSVARRAIRRIADCFDKVDVVIGNHEGRLLRQLSSPVFPTEITRLVDKQDWRIAPYYYSFLVSGGQRFRIEHPKSAAKGAATALAAKFQCHILMAHSHYLSSSFDISGNFWAIQMGHCVDEARLPYAAQRSTTAPAHSLGAVIVRDGYPWLLHDRSPWESLVTIGGA